MGKLDKIGEQERARIDKCFAMAFRQQTSDGETVAAIKSARRLVSKHGITLMEYYHAAKNSGEGDADLGSLSLDLGKIADLERQLDQAQNDLVDAKATIKRLEKEVSATPKLVQNLSDHQPKDGHYTYDAFYSNLLSHLGTPKRALSIYGELTGTNIGKIQSWRRTNRVPVEAYDAVKLIDKTRATYNNHQVLTSEHKRRIDTLSREGKTEAEIVATMSSEFGDRVFNVNMIKGAKTQIRAAYLNELRFDNKTREDARKAFLKRYPGARSVESLLDKAYGK